jgi:chromosome segregation ATPase
MSDLPVFTRKADEHIAQLEARVAGLEGKRKALQQTCKGLEQERLEEETRAEKAEAQVAELERRNEELEAKQPICSQARLEKALDRVAELEEALDLCRKGSEIRTRVEETLHARVTKLETLLNEYKDAEFRAVKLHGEALARVAELQAEQKENASFMHKVHAHILHGDAEVALQLFEDRALKLNAYAENNDE